MAANAKREQLRLLMKQQELEKAKTAPKKIDSPLARYNKQGQVVCILCKVLIKAEALWDAHCQSKPHKENLIKLKESRAKKTGAAPGPQRDADAMDTDENNDEEWDTQTEMPQAKRPKLAESEPQQQRSGLPPGFFDSRPTESQKPEEPEEDEIEVDEEAIQAAMKTMSEEDLAEVRVVQTRANHFNVADVEREVEHEMRREQGSYDEDDEEEEEEDAASALPAGFFDVGQRPKPKSKKSSKPRVVQVSSAPKPKNPSVEDAFAEFSRSVGNVLTGPSIQPEQQQQVVKDADAELRLLLAQVKASDIDFDNIDVEQITAYADDNEEGEDYESELPTADTELQQKQGFLKHQLDAVRRGDLQSTPVASAQISSIQERFKQQLRGKQQDDNDADSSADEAELESLFDWRAKKVSK